MEHRFFIRASNLAVLIRWRGAFNGGSDFMTLAGFDWSFNFTSCAAICFTATEMAWRAWLLVHHPASPLPRTFMSGCCEATAGVNGETAVP
jgi:hypothetical protein